MYVKNDIYCEMCYSHEAFGVTTYNPSWMLFLFHFFLYFAQQRLLQEGPSTHSLA